MKRINENKTQKNVEENMMATEVINLVWRVAVYYLIKKLQFVLYNEIYM